MSTRRIAAQLNVSHPRIWEILNAEGLHPYHHTPVQELLPQDMPLREAFARYILRSDEDDNLFLRSILWTDEAQFTRDGVNNFHNLHVWSEQNPHSSREVRSQYRFSVNIWAGIIDQTIIGPVILPPRLDGPAYLRHLNTIHETIEDEVPLRVRDRIIYQHDGATPHIARPVLTFLNNQYPNRWIGRFAPDEERRWPPRSPDLTPLDFFLWSYVKAEVYKVRINTREQLIQRINDAFGTVKENIHNINLIAGVRRRYHLCILHHGSHFENHL